MNKQVFLSFIILFFFSSMGRASNESNTWMGAYETFIKDETFLSDTVSFSDDNLIWSYAIRDLDNNEVSELLITQCDDNGLNAILSVYSYDGDVYKIGEYENEKGSFISGFRISDDSIFPGLFELWYGGGEENYGYLSIKDGELIYEYLWQNNLSTDPPQQTFYSENQELINESIDLNSSENPMENLLEMHIINDNTLPLDNKYQEERE